MATKNWYLTELRTQFRSLFLYVTVKISDEFSHSDSQAVQIMESGITKRADKDLIQNPIPVLFLLTLCIKASHYKLQAKSAREDWGPKRSREHLFGAKRGKPGQSSSGEEQWLFPKEINQTIWKTAETHFLPRERFGDKFPQNHDISSRSVLKAVLYRQTVRRTCGRVQKFAHPYSKMTERSDNGITVETTNPH